LRIMNYRANLIGASFEIKGTGAPGTRVICSVPLGGKQPSPAETKARPSPN
jgi:hypothetical protein